MLVYPQLATGALTQFPVRKRRRKRTVVNTLADRSTVKLPDPQGEITEWQLRYEGLSDAEATELQQFFLATEGSLNAFTFLDPTANLLAWSDELDNPVWTTAPFLSLNGGLSDPTGGTAGWQAVNSGAAPQTISQTLQAPGPYLYCLSAYARSPQPGEVTLIVASNRAVKAVTSQWQRIRFSSRGGAAAESVEFGIEVPAGSAVELFGLQVEAQPAPSAYKRSSTGGVHDGARFRDDALAFTAMDLNCHSVTVNIIHANSL